MKHFLLSLAFILLQSTAFAQVSIPLSYDDTLALMRAKAVKEPTVKSAVINIEDKHLKIIFDNDTELKMYPDNLHAGLVAADNDESRQVLLDEHMMSMTFDPTKLASFTLLPVLRWANYADVANLPDKEFMVAKPFFEDISIFVVKDTPSAVSFASTDDLEDMNTDLQKAMDTATANLADKIPEINVVGGRPYFVELDGFYESSLLILNSLWDQIEDQVGPVAVGIPNRNTLMFGPLSDAVLLEFMQDVTTTDYAEQPYPIFAHLLVRDDQGGWKRYVASK